MGVPFGSKAHEDIHAHSQDLTCPMSCGSTPISNQTDAEFDAEECNGQQADIDCLYDSKEECKGDDACEVDLLFHMDQLKTIGANEFGCNLTIKQN